MGEIKLQALQASDNLFYIYWEHDGDYGWLDHEGAKTESGAYKNAIVESIKKLEEIKNLSRW